MFDRQGSLHGSPQKLLVAIAHSVYCLNA